MDSYKLQENLEELKALVAQNEAGLRRHGVELNVLPDDIKNKLDMCIETQILMGIHELDELYLNEFYLQKRKEQVDNKLSENNLQAEIDQLKKKIQKENAECEVLKRFLSQRSVSAEESRISASLLKTEIQKLQSKQKQISLPENFDIEELMKKIEILQSKMTEGKK